MVVTHAYRSDVNYYSIHVCTCTHCALALYRYGQPQAAAF